jgi:hypothetical protein
LTIEYLRGSTRPFTVRFEHGKRLTVAYGENGTGKTTICDAFEFLGKGQVGSLENRGLGKTSRFWQSIGKGPADVAVVLEADSTCTARVLKGDVVVDTPQSRPRVEILRREQILSLIAARPADCYEAIKRFVDVSAVEAAEGSLRDLIRDLKKGRETAIARIQENEDAIRGFWEAAGKPAENPVDWAKAEVARDVTSHEAELRALRRLQAAYERMAEYPQQLAERSRSFQETRDALATADAVIRDLLEAAPEDAGAIVEVLESGKTYLDRHPDAATCPLCQSSEKVKQLRVTVEERLGKFLALRQASRQRSAAAESLVTAERRVNELRDSFGTVSTAYEVARTTHQWESDVPAAPPPPSTLDELSEWLRATSDLHIQWGKAETAREGRSQFLKTLKTARDTYQANVDTQRELDQLLPRLDAAHDAVKDERRKFTDAILSAIADEVGRLYELVHPGEGLNKISLALDPAKRASLDITADFQGLANGPPQAYFSQSHLDTLGLCMFLV